MAEEKTLSEIFEGICDKREQARDAMKSEIKPRGMEDVMDWLSAEIRYINCYILSRGTKTDGFKSACKKVAYLEMIEQALKAKELAKEKRRPL